MFLNVKGAGSGQVMINLVTTLHVTFYRSGTVIRIVLQLGYYDIELILRLVVSF